MKIITKEGKSEDFKYELPSSKKKIDFPFQETGIELEPFYGKVIWSLFHKYQLEKIKDAHKVCKEKGILKVAFLIAVIKNLK